MAKVVKKKKIAKRAVCIVCINGRHKNKFVVCQFNRSSFGYKCKNY